ncbi:AAA family ATPase [Streptomyces xanthophaeus]|uniref:AAA family ATPase n=1 Tax=Streptomyces xanthophaeus TaxID=67385 RepID=UPI00341275A9
MVDLLRSAQRNSLIIIDEVESSLHPRAQRCLMVELFEISRKRGMQFILSAHSIDFGTTSPGASNLRADPAWGYPPNPNPFRRACFHRFRPGGNGLKESVSWALARSSRCGSELDGRMRSPPWQQSSGEGVVRVI